MKQLLITGLLILTLPSTFAQKQDRLQRKLVKSFIKDVFNKAINAQIIVDEYLYINHDHKADLSIEKRQELVKNHILEIRKTNESHDLKAYFMPNYDYRSSKIVKLSDYKHLNTTNITNKNNGKTVWVTITYDELKIEQYFLIHNETNKVMSFSLLCKESENDCYFFCY